MNTNYRRSAVALFSLSFVTFYSKIIAYLLMTDLYRYLPQFFRVETSLSHFDIWLVLFKSILLYYSRLRYVIAYILYIYYIYNYYVLRLFYAQAVYL